MSRFAHTFRVQGEKIREAMDREWEAFVQDARWDRPPRKDELAILRQIWEHGFCAGGLFESEVQQEERRRRQGGMT